MPVDPQQLAQCFLERFGQPPEWLVRAPGRVNLIGEHTDYNSGFVLPAAIDRAVWIALRHRDDRQVVACSLDFGNQGQFHLDRLHADQDREHDDSLAWLEYLKGVAWSLQERGFQLAGWEGVVQGDVPVGAGLSSSAALEVATARAFANVRDLPWESPLMAQLCQRAENQWVGVNCGIMDQLTSVAGRDGHALLIDCRSLEIKPVPIPHEAAIAILDTGTRRGLADSAYNERRNQCEAAARFFGKPSLRDVDLEMFVRHACGLDETTRCRALHVITENDRTLQAVEALQRGELCAAGVLLGKSHASLRDDFEVSSDALNAMVEAAMAHPACYGARMTGAGFGGCAVALIQADQSEQFVEAVARRYHEATGNDPAVYVCHPANGAEALPYTPTE